MRLSKVSDAVALTTTACLQVDKYTKSKKSTYATIELFTLKQKANITNDVLDLPNKNDKVFIPSASMHKERGVSASITLTCITAHVLLSLPRSCLH